MNFLNYFNYDFVYNILIGLSVIGLIFLFLYILFPIFLKNLFTIFSSPRVLFTIKMVCLFRFLSFIHLPFIDLEFVGDIYKNSNIMNFIQSIAGDSGKRLSIAALFIMPSIQASIVMNGLPLAIEYFRELRKDSHRRELRRMHNTILTLVIAFLFASFHILYIMHNIPGGAILEKDIFAKIILILILVTTSMILIWISERITLKGVGGGPNFMMLSSIVSQLSSFIWTKFFVDKNYECDFSMVALIIISLSFSFIIIFGETVCYNIKVYFKRSFAIMNEEMDSILPLKLNPAGIMPAIAAQQVISFMNYVFGFILPIFSITFNYDDMDPYSKLLMRALIISVFTFAYLPFQIETEEVADTMKNLDAYITGFKDGKETKEVISDVLSALCVIASLYLIVIIIVPELILCLLDITDHAFTSLTLMIAIYGAIDLYGRVVPNQGTALFVRNKKENEKYNF